MKGPITHITGANLLPTREYMYTHQEFRQASDLVRQFELDVWWDVRGPQSHHNQYDSGTTCPTFQSCLEALLLWSQGQ